MIRVETIPNAVTWAEIKAHSRIDDSEEEAKLTAFALAATEDFELATGFALASRSVTLTVTSSDMLRGDLFVKGPVISVTSVVGDTTLAADQWEVRKLGKQWFIHFDSIPSFPFTVVYVAGHSTVPANPKTAVLLLTDHHYKNRGATGGTSQYVNELGLQRIYDLYDTQRAVAG